jgi:RNA polymerase-binding transcription factor DksA
MDISEKKTNIIINPRKEQLMKESIRNLLQAELADLKEAAKKKRLDPPGKEDKDIDNDGDHDSSDKSLLNRRKTVTKAMGKKTHLCASYVEHAEYGICATIPTQHDLIELAEPSPEGYTHYVSHYTLMDEDGNIFEDVSIKELEILVAEGHDH